MMIPNKNYSILWMDPLTKTKKETIIPVEELSLQMIDDMSIINRDKE